MSPGVAGVYTHGPPQPTSSMLFDAEKATSSSTAQPGCAHQQHIGIRLVTLADRFSCFAVVQRSRITRPHLGSELTCGDHPF